MALIEINTHPSDRQLRQFAGLVLPLAGLIVAGMFWWQFAWPSVALTLAAVVAGVSLAGLFRPALVRPVYLCWMYAAYPIGWVVGHLVIGVIFYLVLTPIGLVMRALGRDPLRRELQRDRSTYWEPRETSTDTSRYFRQF